jgi:DNA-binding helix-hairpin-helix protein with protein kinase domain
MSGRSLLPSLFTAHPDGVYRRVSEAQIQGWFAAADVQRAALSMCTVCGLRWQGAWTDCPGCQAIAGAQGIADADAQRVALRQQVEQLADKWARYKGAWTLSDVAKELRARLTPAPVKGTP